MKRVCGRKAGLSIGELGEVEIGEGKVGLFYFLLITLLERRVVWDMGFYFIHRTKHDIDDFARREISIPNKRRCAFRANMRESYLPPSRKALTCQNSLLLDSKNIPKSNRLIPLLTILLIRILSRRHPLPYPIDPLIIPPQTHDSAQPHAYERQLERVSQDILWRIFRPIEIARHGAG